MSARRKCECLNHSEIQFGLRVQAVPKHPFIYGRLAPLRTRRPLRGSSYLQSRLFLLTGKSPAATVKVEHALKAGLSRKVQDDAGLPRPLPFYAIRYDKPSVCVWLEPPCVVFEPGMTKLLINDQDTDRR